MKRLTDSRQFKRRTLLMGGAASLAGLAGCTQSMHTSNSSSCRNNGPDEASDVTADQEPAQSWKWGELIEDPDPTYKPPRIALINTGTSRQFTVTARQSKTTDSELSRQVTLSDEEYAEFYLQEPNHWELEVTTQSGLQVKREISLFDCNDRTYSIWVQCDGNVVKGESSTMKGCKQYPIDNQSENGGG